MDAKERYAYLWKWGEQKPGFARFPLLNISVEKIRIPMFQPESNTVRYVISLLLMSVLVPPLTVEAAEPVVFISVFSPGEKGF